MVKELLYTATQRTTNADSHLIFKWCQLLWGHPWTNQQVLNVNSAAVHCKQPTCHLTLLLLLLLLLWELYSMQQQRHIWGKVPPMAAADLLSSLKTHTSCPEDTHTLICGICGIAMALAAALL
jgi:hypothetical protein